jgi:hypothetical protein
VIAVRHRLVAAAVAVSMLGIAGDGVGVVARMRLVDGDYVLVDVVAVWVVKVAVMEVVDVIVVAHGGVPAVGPVLV